jgi:mRNA-degrading endonuclease RelE of RelBE toxin-antitoxin system
VRALPDTPEPYRIRFSPTADRQAAALPSDARERMRQRLIQLADLAAFAAGYVLSASKLDSLVAEAEGLSIKYIVDDAAKTLTVLEIATCP